MGYFRELGPGFGDRDYITAKFDESILLWHVATTLCYYVEDETSKSESCKISERLSNYMMYLLVMHPSMLPGGIGEIRFQDTCAEAMYFLEGRSLRERHEACRKLLEVNTDISPHLVKGSRTKSVLFHACILAKDLRSLEVEGVYKWEFMRCVWVELLCYAAGECRSNYHAQQLREGGELLTHVWLLMVHLGLTDHFQIGEDAGFSVPGVQ